MDFNKVILLGNVTRNPEVRYIPGSGSAVARFGIAVNRRYKTGDEVKNDTCFVDIVAFSKLAEFVGEYIAKGMPILLEGRLTFKTWEQDGVKRSKHEISAETIRLVGRKSKEGEKEGEVEQPKPEEIMEDDIPF